MLTEEYKSLLSWHFCINPLIKTKCIRFHLWKTFKRALSSIHPAR